MCSLQEAWGDFDNQYNNQQSNQHNNHPNDTPNPSPNTHHDSKIKFAKQFKNTVGRT